MFDTLSSSSTAPVSSSTPPVSLTALSRPQLYQGKGVAAASETRSRLIEVESRMQPLLPEGGLRRGSTVAISGSTSLALSLISAASGQGSWCAAIGMPSIGLLAASDLGVDLARFPLVPHPGRQWSLVAAALLAEFDVVLVRPTTPVRVTDARRLSARARESGSVLIPVVDDVDVWPQADLRLRCEQIRWRGLHQGYGKLRHRSLHVQTSGKGVASRPRQTLVQLAS